jgi:hypothetical protein
MQLIVISTLLATASALTAQAPVPKIKRDLGSAKVVNRCSYDVHVWSVHKEMGCDASAATVLKTGESYVEKFRTGDKFAGGVSIKLSKFDTCGGKDLSQLEYKIEKEEKYAGNYLDMSFVDCKGGNCPGWNDGYYLKSGNAGDKNGVKMASDENNEHCPIFNVANAVQAAKVAYVDPNDRQTKFCNEGADLELYLCGSEAPGAASDNKAPASSSKPAASSSQAPTSQAAPKPTTTQAAPKPIVSLDVDIVKAAAVTPAAVTPAPQAQPTAVKTMVEYVTVMVDAKRHAHGRRHQQFHA